MKKTYCFNCNSIDYNLSEINMLIFNSNDITQISNPIVLNELFHIHKNTEDKNYLLNIAKNSQCDPETLHNMLIWAVNFSNYRLVKIILDNNKLEIKSLQFIYNNCKSIVYLDLGWKLLKHPNTSSDLLHKIIIEKFITTYKDDNFHQVDADLICQHKNLSNQTIEYLINNYNDKYLYARICSIVGIDHKFLDQITKKALAENMNIDSLNDFIICKVIKNQNTSIETLKYIIEKIPHLKSKIEEHQNYNNKNKWKQYLISKINEYSEK